MVARRDGESVVEEGRQVVMIWTYAAVQYAVTRGNFAFSLLVSFWASRLALPAGICDNGV